MVSSPLCTCLSDQKDMHTHMYSPVDDVASLYEEVNASRPVPVVVHDARHMQNLLRVRQVTMEVSDGDYSPRELSFNALLGGVR